MIVPIICVAIIAFLIVLCFIYFNEIKNWLGSKLGRIFKPKDKKEKVSSKPKPEKKEKKQTYTVEDFKPISKAEDQDVRDISVERLFSMDDLDYFDDNFLKNDSYLPKTPNVQDSQKLTDDDKKTLDEFFKDDIAFKKIKNDNSSNNKTISKQIKDLSPEMKALLIDNVLKKRDDV